MKLSQHTRSLMAANVALFFLTATFSPRPAFAGIKRTAMKIAVCGGGAWGGYKLGEKLAEFEAKKLKLSPAEAAKHRRAFQLGMAAALCGTGVYLTGTVYENLSKRDRKARDRAMMAALADAEPGSYEYVLPDSGLTGKLVTDAPEQEGGKFCRMQVDFLGGPDEPARAKWCKKSENDKYELAI